MYALISHRFTIYFAATFFSILLSAWLSSQQSVINPDAVCYLQSAESMQLGLQVAMKVCDQANWPFYSILIAGLQSVTKFSYVTSAYILNGALSLLSIWAFISIVSFMRESLETRNLPVLSYHKGQGGLLLWLAAGTILLAHEFNSVRHAIVRDHGFWAFYLLSALYFMCFFRVQQWRYAVAFSISMIMATLFRIEGAFFLILIPLLIWFLPQQSWMSRLKIYLQLNTIPIVLGILLCVWILLHPHESTGRLHELQFHRLTGLLHVFQVKADALAQHVLSIYSARDAKVILFFTLLVWYLYSVITNFSFIYSILVLYAWWKKLPVADCITRMVLWGYICINVIVTAAFLAENLFLSQRYLVALSLVLMLWVPFALLHLVQQWSQRKWPLIIVTLCIFISSLGGIIDFGYSKNYIREAGDWVAQHALQNANIYSNDLLVMYYSHHYGPQIFVKKREFADLQVLAGNKWQQYDYLVIRINKKDLAKDSSILQQIKLTPIQIFANKRGDQVRIYRRQP